MAFRISLVLRVLDFHSLIAVRWREFSRDKPITPSPLENDFRRRGQYCASGDSRVVHSTPFAHSVRRAITGLQLPSCHKRAGLRTF